MGKIFVSSTFMDLRGHRSVVNDVLSRMKRQFAAMEFFGSRTDEAVPVCRDEIARCSYFIGIYAWRYGWVPEGDERSITEQEFDLAIEKGLSCLCYVVDEDHPWPPRFIDGGEIGGRLDLFKRNKVSKLVRSTFSSPENLGMQVAADLARELAPPRDERSVGGLLQVNWDSFAPDLQLVILEAYRRAKSGSQDGVLATRHVIAAMAAIPNSSGALLHAMPKEAMPEDEPAAPMNSTDVIAEVFQHEDPFSHCVLGSLQRLLPTHSSTQRLLAIEVAADILKNGRGSSVAKFRQAGIDGAAVMKMTDHAERVSRDTELIRSALDSISDAELPLLGYSIGIAPIANDIAETQRDHLIDAAANEQKLALLAGELMRRNPRLLETNA